MKVCAYLQETILSPIELKDNAQTVDVWPLKGQKTKVLRFTRILKNLNLKDPM